MRSLAAAAAGAAGVAGVVLLLRARRQRVRRRRLLLVRHAESVYNEAYEASGTDPMVFDAPLTARGREQALALREELQALLAGSGSVRVLVSPLSRCLDTCLLSLPPARWPAAAYSVSPVHREVLEASCDIGSASAALAERFPELGAQLRALPDEWWFSPPEASDSVDSRAHFRDFGFVEPAAAVAARVAAFRELLAGFREDVVLVFGHADFTAQFLSSRPAGPGGESESPWLDNCEVREVRL